MCAAACSLCRRTPYFLGDDALKADRSLGNFEVRTRPAKLRRLATEVQIHARITARGHRLLAVQSAKLRQACEGIGALPENWTRRPPPYQGRARPARRAWWVERDLNSQGRSRVVYSHLVSPVTASTQGSRHLTFRATETPSRSCRRLLGSW